MYSSMLREIDGNISMLLDKRLIKLYERSFPNIKFFDIKEKGEINIDFDEHLPIGELGGLFRQNVDSFKNNQKYLIADKIRSENIKKIILDKEEKKLLCGITWKSENSKIGKKKSLTLNDLLPIVSNNTKIQFVNLQYGDVEDEIKVFNKNNNTNIINYSEIDNFNDIDGHASLIEACDILVMSSNSSAHIAGALGKKIHLLVPSSRDVLWYWCNNNNSKNLWYPSINIYQQTIPDNWKDEILIINSEIQLNY
jgi:hypothetical protein